jgi:acetylornithine deacetylase
MIPMELFALVRALVDIPSVTGTEGAIADYLTEFLGKAGFRIKTQTVEGARRNLLALADERPGVILATHLDTVGPHFPFSEDGEWIYGRGACDAKGIMAAMILAASALRDEVSRGVGLLFLAGEETTSDGAKIADAISPRPEYLVMGEPTENVLATGHKGILNLRIRTRGRRAHSCAPELGESAVEKLLDILEALRRAEFGRDPVLGKTTLNIGLVAGGSAPNVIPDAAEAVVSLRIVGPLQEDLDRVKTLAAGGKIEILSQSEPQPLTILAGFPTAAMPFGTDIPHLRDYGKPLLIGPGSVTDAHTDRERVEKGQLREGVEIYKTLVRRLLSESREGRGNVR